MECPAILQELGKRVRQAVNSPEGLALADQCGADSWVCGACDFLAVALWKWLGDIAEPKGLWSSTAYFDHAVVKIGDCFLDADGISTEVQVLDRWNKMAFTRTLEIRPIDADQLACQPRQIQKVIQFLERTIGPGNEISAAIRAIT